MSASRSSTVTVGRDDSRVNGYVATALMDLRDFDQATRAPRPNRLIIAVDFGTTYSAVSYVAIPEGSSPEAIGPRDIRSIKNFPERFETGDQMDLEVPTEVMYPRTPAFRKNEAQDHTQHESAVHDTLEGPRFMDPNFDIDTGDILAEEGDVTMLDDDDDRFRWGYQVHELWSLPETHSDDTYRPLSRFKLLLDNNPTTESVREQLSTTLTELRRRRILSDKPLQVIADFLTHLLRHTQDQLRSEGYDDTYSKEIVLCVPAIWTQKACRDMQSCMALAMERAQFDGVDVRQNSIENLFIVSEPEAAAAYVLSTVRTLQCGGVFVLLDAGGGTVDANTYEISNVAPLRLSEEVVPPGGGLHGSSFLNESFRAYLHHLLDSETYLERDGRTETINGIIEELMINRFEYRIKRSFGILEVPGHRKFPVSGLRDNAEKGFKRGLINISGRKIKDMFLERFRGIDNIMMGQITAAIERGRTNVVLIGGFSASASLKKYLEMRLKHFNDNNRCSIKLICPANDMKIVNAVASGAVLRALNKSQGPKREARSSYGILRAEPFGEHEEHKDLSPYYDRHDGQPYIRNTIDWVLKLGSIVPPTWECEPLLCSHTFDVGRTVELVCKEELYVSDRSTRSHYRVSHAMNQGAEKVGEIVVDFSYLRREGLIKPVEATVNEDGKKTKRHYKVNYTLLIKVVDRDLECFAVYDGRIKEKCRVNIASAFRPGTK
ncbi:unnamed protein product [Clonostachys solani]|uniref:Uncharacterized protein n=1 Tax=Clonostachys solani TaxID=160281 RepID=A0A9P0EP97_9HYPO|nr:unnamed protein product [Clonostachys solani]